MKTIKLYGELGKKFGRIHKFAVRSPAEAVRALCVNFKGFEEYLFNSDKRNVGYKVYSDETNIGEEELKNPSSKIIKFVPTILGAGSSTTKIVLGAVLVVAGIAINYFSAGSLSWLGTPLIQVGIGLIAGGVVQALTPVPKAPEPPEQPDNKPSYNFNGPVNTSAQGQPVPICYGRLIVGGAVISAGISIEGLMQPPSNIMTYTN